jgi:hypothetical protein
MFGMVYFPGIQQIVDANFAFSAHGITPSVCSISIAPQDGMVSAVDTLAWEFGSEVRRFPRCLADSASFERNSQGMVWRLKILDRRWMWKWGAISGSYNRRLPDESVLERTEKTPQELAKLLLEEMGESGYDVGDLPNETRPMIEWDGAVPAEALAELCDKLGCRVVLGIDDKVRIRKAGVGASLPYADTMDASGTLDLPNAPDSIAVLTGRIKFQVDMELEAVGLETSGKVVPIDDLSYKPTEGWSAINLTTFSAVAKEYRDYAAHSVYRWYRTKAPIVIPDQEDVDDLRDVEIKNEVNYTYEDAEGERRTHEAEVYGIFWKARDGLKNNGTSLDPAQPTPQNYRGSFSVDTSDPKHGAIVKFSDPVIRNTETAAAPVKFTTGPAILRLRAVLHRRDPETGGWLRFVRTRPLGGSAGTPTRYSQHDDIEGRVIVEYDTNGTTLHERSATDNTQQWNGKPGIYVECDHYLDAIQAEYQTLTPESKTYAGLVTVEPDGAIQQIMFTRTGEGGMSTTICRNNEQVLWCLPYKERRQLEKTKRFSEWQKSVDVWAAKVRRAIV